MSSSSFSRFIFTSSLPPTYFSTLSYSFFLFIMLCFLFIPHAHPSVTYWNPHSSSSSSSCWYIPLPSAILPPPAPLSSDGLLSVALWQQPCWPRVFPAVLPAFSCLQVKSLPSRLGVARIPNALLSATNLSWASQSRRCKGFFDWYSPVHFHGIWPEVEEFFVSKAFFSISLPSFFNCSVVDASRNEAF